jgi:HEPN domain-containing protein
MKRLTKEWVRKAEADLAVVARIRRADPPLRDETCFHCQQAAEKYLKALLQEAVPAVPRTHNLLELLNLLLPHDATLKGLQRGLRSLRRYAVDYRYPGFRANSRQAQAAIRHAERIRVEFRKRLGLPALRAIR